MPEQLRARRSELATPASSEKMCERSASAGADLVFLDLEDACAPVAKEAARGTAAAAHAAVTPAALAVVADWEFNEPAGASVAHDSGPNALNAAVNGLLFTPKPSFAGTAYLVVTLNDLANTVGPAMQTGKTVTISVA